MAIALSNITNNQENLETYSIIWLDAYVNHSHENRQAQQRLQTIINHLLTFEDEQQCLQHIGNLSKHNRIVFIVSGRTGQKIVPQIAGLRQIVAIYIYCMDRKLNERWAKHFTKVKSIVVQLPELVNQIEQWFIQVQQSTLDQSLPFQIFNQAQNKQFLHYQLFIDCLIRMKTSINDRNEFLSFCQQYYKNNYAQLIIIKEFEKDYSSDRALEWYTRQSFLSRLLNKALREENIDLLFRCRFILHDLGCQLGSNPCSTSIRVYRSQLMSKDELQLLTNSIGEVVSFHSFLSANLNLDQTRLSLNVVDFSTDTEKVFFEIDANASLTNIKPFSIIPSKTQEVLFMVGSLFRIDQIERANDEIWHVRLSLVSLDDQQLKTFVEQMKDNLGIGERNLLQFADLLCTMGKLTNAERYYRRYLNQLPNGHSDIACCYQALGRIAASNNDFKSSLNWCKRSLAVQQSGDSKIADGHHSTANIYSKIGDYKNAMKSYEKALELWEKTVAESHLRIGQCLSNMGEMYEMKKEYSEALNYYQKALQSSEKSLSPTHLDIAMIHRNIGNIYELKDDYQEALIHYQKALEIYRHSLPATQLSVADMEKSIRRVTSKVE